MDFIKKNGRLIVLSVTVISVCIFMTVQPLVILPIAAFAYFVYKNYQDHQPQEVVVTEAMVWSVYRVAVRVFAKLVDHLQIVKPTMVSDVVNIPEVVTKQKLPFVRTHILLQPNNKQDLSMLPAIMQLIQNTLNKDIWSGELDDLIEIRSSNGCDPILVIENVFYESGYLVVDWAIVNNLPMLNYLYSRNNIGNSAVNPNPKLSKDDDDF